MVSERNHSFVVPDESYNQSELHRNKAEKWGDPIRQRRLKRAITSGWEALLAMEQPELPLILQKITKGKISKVAAINLWMSPSPWIQYENNMNEDSVQIFLRNRQADLWKNGQQNIVIEYFKNITGKNEISEGCPKIPVCVWKISEGRITDNALKTFWLLPSPWLWRNDERDYELDTNRSPQVMWDDGFNELVIDYMRVLSKNLLPLPKK